MKDSRVIGLCALAGLLAIGIHSYLFPFLSNNSDEAVYQLQANMLLKGKVWLENTPVSPFFLTWFQKLWGHKIVFKYTPVHASILAAGKYLTGHFEIALGAIAAAVVASMYCFCREMALPRKSALLATSFLLFSPLFLIQSATFLPYCSSLALLLSFATLFARGLRLHSPLLLVGSGILVGIAFFARPYDALLFSLVWLLIYPDWKSRWRQLFWQCVWLMGGCMPVLILIMLFNTQTTGHPLVFPFRQNDLDTFGLGLKRVFDGVGFMYFDFDNLVQSTSQALWQLVLWNSGGIITILLALGYFAKKHLRRTDYAIWAVAFIYPAGYCFFWGMLNLMSWGALYYLGPFYYMPCLVPLSIYAAKSLRLLLRRYPFFAQAILVIAIILVTCSMLFNVVQSNLVFVRKFQALYQPFNQNPDILQGKNLIFVPPTYGNFLLHPYRMLSNDNLENGTSIYAVNRGMENFVLWDQYPTRRFFRFDVYGIYSESADSVNEAKLVPLHLVTGKDQFISVLVTAPEKARRVRICIAVAEEERCVVDTASQAGKSYQVKFRVTPAAISLVAVQPADARLPQSDSNLALQDGAPIRLHADFFASAATGHISGNARSISYEYRYFIRKKAGELQSILPPEKWVRDFQSRQSIISDSEYLRSQ